MKKLLVSIALLLLFNTAIAALLTAIAFGEGFWINLLFSQCIGITIALTNVPLVLRIAPGWRRWLVIVLMLPLSVLLGNILAHLISGIPLPTDKLWSSLAVGLMFGVIGSTVFLLAQRIQTLDAEVRQRRLDEAERTRREMEAHLKLLQAQIEPHFLFNTLANVSSLIDTDAERARKLLDRLTDWLRIALVRVRRELTTLDDELRLLENWLEIVGVRFGERLRWRIDATPQARQAPIPPMLLQPLLENAVKHGIEPKLGSGEVRIKAEIADNKLIIEVSDNGVGLDQKPAGPGTGLENVRARLAALFGKRGHLSVSGNGEGGVTAILELPCAP